MTSFDKKWSRPERPGMSEKLRDSVKHQDPLKPQIQVAVNKLQTQIGKLDSMITKLSERDTRLFQRIVTAMHNHDTQTSKVLSNELAEVRKVLRMLGNGRMSLEQVQMRLTTMHDLGDAMMALGPTMKTMASLKVSLRGFMPEADSELNSMTQTLNGLMMDSVANESFGIESEYNEETDKIMREAAEMAEQHIGDKFPSVPTPTDVTQKNTAYD